MRRHRAKCLAPGCNGKHHARGLCSTHYDQWRYHRRFAWIAEDDSSEDDLTIARITGRLDRKNGREERYQERRDAIGDAYREGYRPDEPARRGEDDPPAQP